MAQISIETYRRLFLGVIITIVAFVLIVFAVAFLNKDKVDISINSVPEGATFEFRENTYKTPMKLKNVKEGSYQIKISKEGYFERKEKIKVSKDSNDFVLRLYTVDTSPEAVGSDLFLASQVKDSDVERLLQHFPHKAKKFRVEYKLVSNKSIILISLLDKKDLGKSGEEALEWIRSKGANPDKLTIEWLPRNPF